MSSCRAAGLCHSHIRLLGEALLVFGGGKQMAALFPGRIYSCTLRLCEVLGAHIQLCPRSSHMGWISAIQPLQLRGCIKNPKQIHKTPKQTKHPHRIITGGCFNFFPLFNVIALFVFAPPGIQQLEFSWLACWHWRVIPPRKGSWADIYNFIKPFVMAAWSSPPLAFYFTFLLPCFLTLTQGKTVSYTCAEITEC